MSDSNSTTTRSKIIRRSFRRIGIDSPGTDETANAVELLNDVVAELDPLARWLHAISNTESTITVTSGVRSYSTGTGSNQISPYIQALETVTWINGTSRVPLRIVDKTEATRSWELQTTTSQPHLVHLEIAADPADQKLIFLPPPNGTYTINYTFQRMLYDMDSAGDSPDFRRSMRHGLVKILANELAPEYGYAGQLRQELMAEAQEARQMLRAHNTERFDATPVVATYF